MRDKKILIFDKVDGGKMTDKEIAKAINTQAKRIHKKMNPFFVIWYCNLLIISVLCL